MTTGLIEGWQHFADDLRGDHPLLARRAWLGALQTAGFAECGAWPPRGSLAEALGQHVIVAQVAGDAQGGTASAATSAADTGCRRAASAPTRPRNGASASIRWRRPNSPICCATWCADR